MQSINDFLARLVFFVAMDVRVVGQDGEFADYDNPHGYIYGDVYYVKARIEGDKLKGDGLQWAHKHNFVNNEAGATALMERIKAAHRDRPPQRRPLERERAGVRHPGLAGLERRAPRDLERLIINQGAHAGPHHPRR